MAQPHLLFLDSIGGGELVVIMLFILMFFGSEKIPGIAKGLGKGMREFRSAMNSVQNEVQKGVTQVEKQIQEEMPAIEIKPAENAVQKVEEIKQEVAESSKEKDQE